MRKIFLLVAIVLCIALSHAAFRYGDDNMNKICDVYELYNDLNNETATFEFDDALTVNGVVVETGISIWATPYVSLSDKKDGTVYVTCVLPRADTLKLKDFKKGEKVTMQGNYYDFHNKVIIKKCKKN